jgi:acetoin utilization deacetylase AcuC-like enzyme
VRVHTAEHLSRVSTAFQQVAQEGGSVALDKNGDTAVHTGTPLAALRAAGLVVAAVDEVLGPSSAHNRAFVMSRPPGHHAEPDKAMGFCFFNNVMVGVAHAEDVYDVKRIAILDFDVHHGNGDEAMSTPFACSTHRLYASSHQDPWWPNTGSPKDPSDDRMKHIINVGLPAESGSAAFRKAWRDEILPAVKDFSPDMVFLSAGFDAHADDPLATLNLDADDFKWITEAILEIGDMPVVSVLEGGYDINSLGLSAHKHVQALVETPRFKHSTNQLISEVAEQAAESLENQPSDEPSDQPSDQPIIIDQATKQATKKRKWWQKDQKETRATFSWWLRPHPSGYYGESESQDTSSSTKQQPTRQPTNKGKERWLDSRGTSSSTKQQPSSQATKKGKPRWLDSRGTSSSSQPISQPSKKGKPRWFEKQSSEERVEEPSLQEPSLQEANLQEA